MKYLFLFTIFYSSLLYSSDKCNRVYLARDKWDLNYKNMPNYDQGATNTCYAYTAIQLMDYWRLTHGLRITKNIALSDPMYAAYLFKKYSFANKLGSLVNLIGKPTHTPLDFGLIQSIIDEIRKYGMCTDLAVSKSIENYARKIGVTPGTLLEVINYLFGHFNAIKRDREWYKKVLSTNPEKFNNRFRNYFCRYGLQRNLCREALKVYDVITPYFAKGKAIKLYDEIFKECQKPENKYLITKKMPSPKTYTLRPAKWVKKKIIKSLNRKNPQPVGITYCMDVLMNSDHVGLSRINFPKKNCGLHASIIIGKRERNGRCEFFLKNTGGEDCSFYDDTWECVLHRGIKYNKWSGGGRSHGIWIDAHQLSRNIIQFTYF
ncbi:MAG: hypothetical protein E2O68_01440 [Deltaproteobacteria bacterium]|nr:MAG: hypothetical protein E2O68_01440 [Deltaproteobacteria bacterium]